MSRLLQDFDAVVLLLAALVVLLWGIWIYSKKPGSYQVRVFAGFILCSSGWVSGIFFDRVSFLQGIADPLPSKLAFFWASLTLPTLLHFVLVFPNRPSLSFQRLLLIYALPFVFSGLSLTPHMVRSVQLEPWGLGTDYGPLQAPFMVYFVSYLGVIIATYAGRYRAAGSTLGKLQLRYVGLGLVVAFFLGTLCNLVIPVIWKSEHLVYLGPLASLVCIFFFTYALLRHQLLDIAVIIRRTVVFAGLVGFMVSVVSLAAFVSQDLLGWSHGIYRIWSNIFAAVLIATVYGPLRTWLVNVTDKYLFQKKYDYKQFLKKFTDEVRAIRDLQKLIDVAVSKVAEMVRLEDCSIFLLSRFRNRYEMMASVVPRDNPPSFEESHPLVKYLKETKGALAMDYLAENQPDRSQLEEAMKQMGGEVCLPLSSLDDLVGFLVLGHKKSDEGYTRDDIEVLMALANTEGMAISTALLAAETAQKEKLAIIGTLASAIDHEVSKPLGNIRMWAERFLMEWEQFKKMPREQFEEKMAEFLRLVMEEIDRAVGVTRRFAGFAKPIREVKRIPIEVVKVVHEVFALFRQSSAENHIVLEEAFPANLPRISADPRQISQILFNLVNNSIQAIGERSGKVTVRANVNGGDRLAVDVIDTGSGIPAGQLRRLFTAYDTTKPEGKGTGLGLFLVKMMVEENGGTISVQSRVGEGTAFTIEFPIASPNPADGI